jgi:hypothetical protein
MRQHSAALLALGLAGGTIDSATSAPGPLLLQGDHGPVEFRSITLTPAQ